jgi:hypothetical protein
MLFFDAFTRIGPRVRKHPAHPWKLVELVAELDHCSIAGALVASTMSVQYDPLHANRELSAQVEPYDHLFPIWNVMPHQTGEFPKPAALEKLLRRHRVRAVTIYPFTNHWDWLAPHARDLFHCLQANGILLIVDRTEVGAGTESTRYYRELEEFLKRHHRLSVLLTGAAWFDQRFLLPLLPRHANLHLTFDHFQVHYGLDDLVAQGFGETGFELARDCGVLTITHVGGNWGYLPRPFAYQHQTYEAAIAHQWYRTGGAMARGTDKQVQAAVQSGVRSIRRSGDLPGRLRSGPGRRARRRVTVTGLAP